MELGYMERFASGREIGVDGDEEAGLAVLEGRRIGMAGGCGMRHLASRPSALLTCTRSFSLANSLSSAKGQMSGWILR
jgi:hypothetical protein